MEASENAGIVFHRRRIKNQWHFHTKILIVEFWRIKFLVKVKYRLILLAILILIKNENSFFYLSSPFFL